MELESNWGLKKNAEVCVTVKLTSVEAFLVSDQDVLGSAVSALDGTTGAEHLHPLVVPEGAPPRVLDHAERAVLIDDSTKIPRNGSTNSPMNASSSGFNERPKNQSEERSEEQSKERFME